MSYVPPTNSQQFAPSQYSSHYTPAPDSSSSNPSTSRSQLNPIRRQGITAKQRQAALRLEANAEFASTGGGWQANPQPLYPSSQPSPIDPYASPFSPLASSPTSPSSRPVLHHISRPARSRQRLGDAVADANQSDSPNRSQPFSPSADQTGEVTQVLQSIRNRQDERMRADQTKLDSPDKESAAEERRRIDWKNYQLSVGAPSFSPPTHEEMNQQSSYPSDQIRVQAADPVASAPLPPPPTSPRTQSAPSTEPGLCTCCPCIDSFTSPSCLGSLSSTLSNWLGIGTGTDTALAEMRQGVILPQDASKLNIQAVESSLNKLPNGCVINIRCRRSEELLASSSIVHPMVKVHLIDLRTGEYWRKKDPSRHAVAPYENLRHRHGGAMTPTDQHDSLGSILPIMTQPYKLQSKGSFSPAWDENLLINEPLRHLLDPHAIIFFELLDFGPSVDLNLYPSGYFPIAWAFLKPVSARGEPNIGINQQLQLYQYTNCGVDTATGFFARRAQSRTAYHKAGVPSVYYEWIWQKHTGRRRYPSTFYMDLTGVAPPKRETVKGARPILPTQIEEGRMDYDQLLATVKPLDEFSGLDNATADGRRARKHALEQMTPSQKAAIVRRRQVGEDCQLPNKLVGEISAGTTGCFVLRYSPDGRTLAAACGDGIMFTIKLYDSDTGRQLFTYIGHHDLIYDLSWNCIGSEIVSGSSDGTAKVWAVDSTRMLPAHQLKAQPIATLQHTGFVYACVFHPKVSDKNIIMTGSFDGGVRIWNNRGELLHTFSDHTSHVNTIVWSSNGTRIFTGDSTGNIRIWEDINFTRGDSALSARGPSTLGPNASSTWATRIRCLHTISHEDLKGTVIACIRYHARPERLVVYCRNNCMYVFSLLRYDLRHVFSGIPSQSHSLRCTISPDGNKVVAGGEDGQAYFWDLNRGQLEKVLQTGFHTPIYDIAWHPTQHAVATASFGGDYPIRIFEFNQSVHLAQTQQIQD